MSLSLPTVGDRRHPLVRVRYQILGGLAFAVLLPALLRTSVAPEVILTSNMQVTIAAAVVAHISGFFIYRKMGAFPGLAAAGYILPTFLFTYGTVFLVIFLFRFDYSRFQAVSSFTLSTLWYFGMSLIVRRVEPYSLAVVPGGEVERLDIIRDVTWRRLAAPSVPVGRVHGVVADLRADLSDDWERFIADTALSGTPIYHVKQIIESLTGRVEIAHLSENTLGSLNPNQAYIKVKQMIDWLAASIGLILLAPFLAVIALAIRLESPGPALFRQERMGYGGRSFTVYKFRTMSQGSPEDANDRSLAVTKPRDARITRVGRFLRRSRLDELPQIINILRTEMSWIGPRPEATVLSSHYSEVLPFYRYRNIVRPGISGWAQVNQGYVAEDDDEMEKLYYDFYYIKNFSPWLDIVILLRTVRTILTGFGSR